jgi:hypothetical protein
LSDESGGAELALFVDGQSTDSRVTQVFFSIDNREDSTLQRWDVRSLASQQ